MNQYPLWKYVLIVAVVLTGAVYSLPNLFDQDPSMLISGTRRAALDDATEEKVAEVLAAETIPYKAIERDGDAILVRFKDSESQLKGKDQIERALGDDYSYALTLRAYVPAWLKAIDAQPMYLGLDLRGGVHILIDVDMDAAVDKAYERYTDDIRSLMRDNKVRYTAVTKTKDGVVVKLKAAELLTRADDLVADEYRNLQRETAESQDGFTLTARMNETEKKQVRDFALKQNITTLRNRVNALGVAEPIIQQQGDRRIVVQLPGADDPTRIKELLGATATLEYRLADTEHSVQDALDGRVPVGAKLYRERDGTPILLKKRIIVTGDQITDARSGLDSRSGRPAVFVTLDGQGARRMRNVTTENVGKPMAVVFIENRTTTSEVDGKKVRHTKRVEEVISVANILEPFGRSFQTTGLDSTTEAQNLALLLRAGALAAPIEIVEERTIGPSLGRDNIDQGFRSVLIGFVIVLVFMGVYYRVFGLVANLALALNLVLIVAILSMLQATLTLPGIAGIVLTVGMAVDANVLIFERIREELRLGNSPHSSISAGYEKAFSTIVDANITTLIAAVVLFSFGTGPVKGFAVTLLIGILTSMFTAILGTRGVINLIYGGRRLTGLSI